MLVNPALPSWKFSSPITNSWRKVPPSISPSSQPLPQTKKILLKTPVYFPITITICKHRSKFVTCCPSHGDSGGVSRPQRHSYKVFLTTLNKIAISEFWSVDFGKIISMGGGLGALQFFGHLKRALELFISIRMSPLAIF